MTLQGDLIAINDEIAVKRVAMHALFDGVAELKPEQAGERTEAIRRANLELDELAKKRDEKQELVEIEAANTAAMKNMRRPVDRQTAETSTSDEGEYADDIVSVGYKSVRELIAKAPIEPAIRRAKGLKDFRGELGSLALKTLITSADMTPLEDRQSRIVPYPTEQRFTVGDLLLPGTTSAQKITYFEETTFTNSADTVAEGSVKPESALDFTLREDDVRKIATWIPVTDEMMEDVPGFESYLRQRLGFMVQQKEESKLLNGAGGSDIEGILVRSGIQTVTGYGLSTLDSIYRAMTLIRTNAFAEPNAMVVHPKDWFDIRTSKDTTGNYLLGPATAEGPSSVWGLTVRQTTAIAENTGLVGDFSQGQVFRRSGIAIAISTENQDFFIYNKLAVRAEERLALAVYRPAAFCKVEAIVVGS